MRELTKEDMIRAKIPELYWTVKLKHIPDRMEYKERVKNYIKDLPSFVEDGIGLFLWAEENSSGKTSLANVIGKYAMKHGHTYLFITAYDLIQSTFSKESFDGNETLFRRAHEVDVLTIDDVDKEYKDGKGFSNSVIENVIRHRRQKKKTTIMTSNLTTKMMKEVYSVGMTELLRESTIPIEVYGMSKGGINWRREQEKKLKNMI